MVVTANTLCNSTREDTTHRHHQMVNTEIRLIMLFAAKVGETLHSQQKQDWDCGSVPELLIAKFRFKLKKVGKATRPFRYDLNQSPSNYTVKVTNRFKELNLIECLKSYCTGGSDQDHPQKKKLKKAKWFSEEALQIVEKRREVKGKEN